jgi:hypothetical protein
MLSFFDIRVRSSRRLATQNRFVEGRKAPITSEAEPPGPGSQGGFKRVCGCPRGLWLPPLNV